MLKDKESSAIVAVGDIARAKQFYGGVLGLELADDSISEVVTYKTGPSTLVVYSSAEAGTNRANAVVWGVGGEIDAIIAALKSKGVVFEHYSGMQGVTLQGDVHVAGNMKMAWFKDPDGNILHINNM